MGPTQILATSRSNNKQSFQNSYSLSIIRRYRKMNLICFENVKSVIYFLVKSDQVWTGSTKRFGCFKIWGGGVI